MRSTHRLLAGLAVLALGGCTHVSWLDFSHKPGRTVTFVSANASTVLVDFGSQPDGEMKFADAMAKDKCALFGKDSAKLESLNPREHGVIRATYLCN